MRRGADSFVRKIQRHSQLNQEEQKALPGQGLSRQSCLPDSSPAQPILHFQCHASQMEALQRNLQECRIIQE